MENINLDDLNTADLLKLLIGRLNPKEIVTLISEQTKQAHNEYLTEIQTLQDEFELNEAEISRLQSRNYTIKGEIKQIETVLKNSGYRKPRIKYPEKLSVMATRYSKTVKYIKDIIAKNKLYNENYIVDKAVFENHIGYKQPVMTEFKNENQYNY